MANGNQNLTITAASSSSLLVPSPIVNYISPNATASVILGPAPGLFGSAIITVTVNGGAATNNSVTRFFTVTVNPVNQPPTLDSLNDLTINENAGTQTINLSGITSGAPNENQNLTLTATSSNPGVVPVPTLNYTSPNATGSLSLTPMTNSFGAAIITVTVNDGAATYNSVSRSFRVTVNPVNQPPTLDPLSDLTINENDGTQIITLSGITSGATNENQNLALIAISSNPGVVPVPTLNYTSPDAAGSLSLTPMPNSFGAAIITVTLSDGAPTNNIVSRSFMVTVHPDNQGPTLNALSDLTMNENDGPQPITLSGIAPGASNADPHLRMSAMSSNPSLVPIPAVIYTNPDTMGSLILAPAPNSFGSAIISVTVDDGTATNNIVSGFFTVTVNPVNQPPTLNALIDLAINENDGTQTITLSGITSGATNENQNLTLSATSSNPDLIPVPALNYTSPNDSGSLSFSPMTNSFGAAIITVTVNDGAATNNSVSLSFTVTVNPVNQPPTLNALSDLAINENDGTQTITLSGITSGATNENQSLTLSATSSNPGLTPVPTIDYSSPNDSGSLSFIPMPNSFGAAIITVTVNDGAATNNIVARSFTLTVNPVNQPPTLNALSDLAINENDGPQTIALSGITSGATNENQNLTLSATSSNPGLTPVPTIDYTSPNDSGSLSFTPMPNSFGAAIITVTVNDGAATNNIVTRSFTLTVNPVNQPPTLNSLSNLTINENAGAQTINLSGITSGAPNENQNLTLTATSSNPGVVPVPTLNYTSPHTTGSLRFSPRTNAFGSALITVTVNDGQATNNLINRSFTVTVNAVNQRPTLNPLNNLTINANAGWQTVNLSGITAGPGNEIQTLTLTATSSIPNLIANPIVSYTYPSATGALGFKSAANAAGIAMLRVTVNDGQGTNNAFYRSFTVTVKAFGAKTPTLVPQILAVPAPQADGSALVSAKPMGGGTLLKGDLPFFQAWASTNLLNWDWLPVPLVLSNNWMWLRDYRATNYARRYYRIIGTP